MPNASRSHRGSIRHHEERNTEGLLWSTYLLQPPRERLVRQRLRELRRLASFHPPYLRRIDRGDSGDSPLLRLRPVRTHSPVLTCR